MRSAVVAIVVGVSSLITILYSLQWGADKSNLWLVTFFLGFLHDVVILKPTQVTLRSHIYKPKPKF